MMFRLNPYGDALFLDIDGTLLDIAPEAKAVIVPEGLRESLSVLAARLGGALALVSGRTVENVDSLFAPLRLPVAGVHGFEQRLGAGDKTVLSPALPHALRETIIEAFQDWQGVAVEDKLRSIAVHYRQAPRQEGPVKARLGALLSGRTRLKIVEGRKVFDVMGTGGDKGQAVEAFMRVPPFKGRRPVFIGDDVTDFSGIGACVRLGGLGVRVGKRKPGARGALSVFDSPAQVRLWIKKMGAEA